MADITQTAANVGLSTVAGTPIDEGQAGEAITQGNAVYRLASDGKWYQADASAEASAAAGGIAMTPAATDGRFIYVLPDSYIDLGATLTVGDTLYVSVNAGAIADAQPASTNYVTILGVVITASKFWFKPQVSGIQTP